MQNGKIIYITVDQFLALSDEELDSLSSMNVGEYARSPWVGSAIKSLKKKVVKEDQEEPDTSIDFTEESEELSGERPVITDEVYLEDIPDQEENPEKD